jgi:hypothetical protein
MSNIIFGLGLNITLDARFFTLSRLVLNMRAPDCRRYRFCEYLRNVANVNSVYFALAVLCEASNPKRHKRSPTTPIVRFNT